MPKQKTRASVRTQKTGVLNPRHYAWNVFDDFGAYRTYFTLIVIAYSLYALWHASTGGFHEAASASLITFAALLPSYIWTRGNLPGLPIFPIYAATFVYTFSLQIINRDEITDLMKRYTATSSDLWISAVIISGYLLFGTAAWVLILRKQLLPPQTCHAFRDQWVNPLTFALFICSTFVTIGFATEKIYFLGSLSSAARAFSGTISTVAGFVLAYRMGQRVLPKPYQIPFILVLLTNLIAASASLLLVDSISLAGTVVAAYTLGRRKVPWLALVILLPLAFILHEGKGDMRVKYWSQEKPVSSVKLYEYPAYFYEWFQYGWESVTSKEEHTTVERADLIERTGLIQIFLVPYFMSPDTLPYLKGETYKDLPLMVIPRIIYPKKPVAHAGQRYLCVYYQLQDERSTLTTSIGWGLFCEAYANFGPIGTLFFGGFIGLFLAWLTRISSNVPIMTFRGIIGILTLAFAVQSEMTSGVWVSAFSQAVIIIFGMRVVLMEKQINPEATGISGSTRRPRTSLRRLSAT
ncbi:MAG: hypothetical protein AAF571_00935 [Verrucomicrobiota bacterium]